MSYPATGLAAVSFPLQTLQNEAHSVPGSHRAIAPHAPDVQDRVDLSTTPSKVIAQPQAANPVKVEKSQAPAQVDTVTLSTVLKVLKLQREGESPLQIAATLNLPTKEVQSDLHLDLPAAQSFTVAPVTTPLSGNTTATVSAPTISA